MGFQDVDFLPFRACFSMTFFKYCGRDEGLRITTNCGWDMERHAPCEILLLQQSPLFVSVEFHVDHKTYKYVVKFGHP